MNSVREKIKPRWKILYTIFKGKYEYDPLIYISPFTTLTQIKYFLGGIQHCVTVVRRCVFESNFPFALTITRDNLDYCFNNDNEKIEWMVTKEYWNPLGFSQQRKIKVSFRRKNSFIIVDNINML